MLKEEIKQVLKQSLGITDDDFETHVSYPKNLKMWARFPELKKYKIVAEVKESKYCSGGLKVGQKYTFSLIPSALLIEESNCPLCVRAIAPIANLMAGYWDRIMEGVDPNQGIWDIAECLDPGVNAGGLGHVIFKVYAQKI